MNIIKNKIIRSHKAKSFIKVKLMNKLKIKSRIIIFLSFLLIYNEFKFYYILLSTN